MSAKLIDANTMKEPGFVYILTNPSYFGRC